MTGQSTASAPVASAHKPRGRIVWLDVLRLVCAVEIVGYHWLRAGHQVGLYGQAGGATLAEALWGNNQRGLSAIHLLLIDTSGLSVSSIVNNVIGVAFGFGWEAVNVFILLSGLTLAYTTTGSIVQARPWRWYGRRLRRILLPYYCVAGPILAAALIFRAAFTGHPGVLGAFAEKIDWLIPGSWNHVLLVHAILLDPSRPQWVAAFFSPAWWFVPAILVGYACFPVLLLCLDRFGGRVSLLAAFGITVATYRLVADDVLLDNAWYFVVLNECFSFMLGMVLGRSLLDADGRQRIVDFLASRRAVVIGVALFVLGNVLNVFTFTYPLASPAYSIGMSMVLGGLAVRLARFGALSSLAQRVDIYLLYLLHQPFAFPVALICAPVLGHAGLSIGLLIFLVIVSVGVVIVGAALQRLKAADGPRRLASQT